MTHGPGAAAISFKNGTEESSGVRRCVTEFASVNGHVEGVRSEWCEKNTTREYRKAGMFKWISGRTSYFRIPAHACAV